MRGPSHRIRPLITAAALASGAIWVTPTPAHSAGDTKILSASGCLPLSGSPDVERLADGSIRGLEVGERIEVICPVVRDREYYARLTSNIRVANSTDDGIDVSCSFYMCAPGTSACEVVTRIRSSSGWGTLDFGSMYPWDWYQHSIVCEMGFNDHLGAIFYEEHNPGT